MSYTFYIEADHPPLFSELFKTFPQLSMEGEKPASDGAFAPDYFYHVYEDCVSVRSLEIGFSTPSEHLPKNVSIRIMTASSKDDYELGLALAGYFAGLYGNEIEGESEPPMAYEAFKEHFSDDWVNQMVRSGPRTLRAMVTRGDSDGPYTLSGTRRSFHFGKKSLAKIDSDDDDVFIENYFALARRVQYIDEHDDFFAASVMKVTNETGDSCLLSVWAPGVDYLFPDVKYLSVMNDEYLIVPIELLEEFTKVKMIDDRYRTAKRVEEKNWDAVIARAKEVQIDPSNLS